MVRRKLEEMNFTYIECLLYIFHHLAHKVSSLLLYNSFLFFFPFMQFMFDIYFCIDYCRLPMLQIVYVATRLSLANLLIGLGKISQRTIKTSLRGASHHLVFFSISFH